MPKSIPSSIVCPSCGQKGAVIQDEYKSGQTKTWLFHDLCGYKVSLYDYVLSFFGKSIPTNINVTNRELHITSPHEYHRFTIRQIVRATNQHFTSCRFDLTGKLRKRACPICDKSTFQIHGENICCAEKHFFIPAYLFFISFIEEPFTVEEKKDAREKTFTVNCKDKNRHLIGNNYYPLAEIVYRQHPENGQHILVVNPFSPKTSDDYRNLLWQIKNISPFFKIIEKVKS